MEPKDRGARAGLRQLGRALKWFKAGLEGLESGRWFWPAVVGLAVGAIWAPGWGPRGWAVAAGVGLAGTVLVRVSYGMWYRAISPRPRPKDLVLMGILVVGAVAMSRLGVELSHTWASSHGWVVGLAMPVGLAGMVCGAVVGRAAGMLVGLCAGLLGAVGWPQGVWMGLYYLLVSVVGAHYAAGGRSRLSLMGAGACSAGAGVMVATAMALAEGWIGALTYPLALVASLLGGLITGVMATGLAPAVELVGGYTTRFRLMELASLDQPLLRKLMLAAPGTYHHSLVVSSMVEAAAREIGADSLLAKVAGLYHDLGKIDKPAYFVENQGPGPNRHDKLAPSMSALILIRHVKRGVELAKKHRLGKEITDIIAQHHGRRLIHYFYNKALEARRASGRADPDPELFRYPGPRPQSREAALVMLADAVEAASRSLEEPSPARIQGLVQEQINRIFAEGELNECELTLKDLHKIARIFNKILTGIFHQRVEYPASETVDNKRTRDYPPASRVAGEADTKDLRRLGIERGLRIISGSDH